MGTAIKHRVPDRVKLSFVIFLTSGRYYAQGWASDCPDVKTYKWRLNPFWHRMLYGCTLTASVGVRGLMYYDWCLSVYRKVTSPMPVLTAL